MQTVSSEFKQEKAQPVARPAALLAELIVTDPEVSAGAMGQAQQSAPWADAARPLSRKGAKGPGTATLEPGRMKADGAFITADGPAGGEGWVSGAVSGPEGLFKTPPAFSVRLPFAADLAALTFFFDTAAGEWPARIRVTPQNGPAREYEPNGEVFETPDSFAALTGFTVEFLQSAKPFRRARLARLVLGRCLSFGPKNITAARWKRSVDPIGRRLPAEQFSFEAVNLAGFGPVYDPDDADSLWRYTEERSPITLRLGQKLACGRWEWLDGGEYYLTGRPSVGEMTVSFEATGPLGLLDEEFFMGVWDGGLHSLYDLAVTVLENSRLARLYPGEKPWVLWEGLKNRLTRAPLPRKPGRECLQLIAHAARCVLFCDRRGRVCILPRPQGGEAAKLPLSAQLGSGPRTEKNPALSAVECPAFQYRPAEKPQVLHKGEYPVNGRRQLMLEYPAAADITVGCEGAVLEKREVFAAACRLTLSGSGTALVKVEGRPLSASRVVERAEGPARPGTGQLEKLENPLITEPAQALAAARWAAQELCRRTVYHCETRGDAEFDPLDEAEISTRLSTGLAACILENSLEFSGGSVKGSLVLKRQNEPTPKGD